MKTWREFENQRLKEDEQPLGNISLDGRGEDALSVMYRLINLAWENHRGETKSFFNGLAKKDPHVQQEWEKIEREAKRFSSPSNDSEDEVMVPNADSGNGDDGDDE